MNLPPQPPISDIWPRLTSQDWLNRNFTREKAYICAILAELAYWHIPQFELSESDRIKIVPSTAYQQLALYARADEMWNDLRQRLDMEPTVIARQYAVVVVARTSQVIFVSIRGTAAAYDWLINADLRLTPHHWPRFAGRFHQGFYAAMSVLGEAILTELLKHGSGVPVYVVGHSLGGAMAAIFHAINGACEKCGDCDHGYRTYCAYTYGMPRYGDKEVIRLRPCPHHIVKADDIVPRVPPQWLGYENTTTEYSTDGRPLNRAGQIETMPSARWGYRLMTGRAVSQHFMEQYRAALVP
jgi:predicted lipase